MHGDTEWLKDEGKVCTYCIHAYALMALPTPIPNTSIHLLQFIIPLSSVCFNIHRRERS